MNKKGLQNRPFVFLPCTGLGHVNRGYESFSSECFEQLKDSDKFELVLLKSSGKTSDRELNISCIKRTSKAAHFIFKVFKVKHYILEQVTFFINMVPYIFKYKPSVIYYSDTGLGKLLWYGRKFLRLNYKILLSNGAPKHPPYKVEDHIQQLLNLYVDKSIKAGVPRNKQTVLHYAVDFDNQPDFQDGNIKIEMRKKLGLSQDKKIIISVGAVNSYHKRMDYVVKEFSHLDKSTYFLIILGNIDNSSNEILELAKSLLPVDSYSIKQVPSEQVSNYLLSADYFILASFHEGLPRVLIEALQHGLLPIVHDYDVAQEVLAEFAVYENLSREKVLLQLLKKADQLEYRKEQLWAYAYNAFSWQSLKGQYIDLIAKNIV